MKKRLHRPKAIHVYFPPPLMRRVKAAAARAGLSASAYCVRSVAADLDSDSLTDRLLQAPAFRGAVADVFSRPSVIADLAERLRGASGKQLELFKASMARGLEAASSGQGKG